MSESSKSSKNSNSKSSNEPKWVAVPCDPDDTSEPVVAQVDEDEVEIAQDDDQDQDDDNGDDDQDDEPVEQTAQEWWEEHATGKIAVDFDDSECPCIDGSFPEVYRDGTYTGKLYFGDYPDHLRRVGLMLLSDGRWEAILEDIFDPEDPYYREEYDPTSRPELLDEGETVERVEWDAWVAEVDSTYYSYYKDRARELDEEKAENLDLDYTSLTRRQQRIRDRQEPDAIWLRKDTSPGIVTRLTERYVRCYGNKPTVRYDLDDDDDDMCVPDAWYQDAWLAETRCAWLAEHPVPSGLTGEITMQGSNLYEAAKTSEVDYLIYRDWFADHQR